MAGITISGVFSSVMAEILSDRLEKNLSAPEIEILIKLKELKKTDSNTLSKRLILPKELIETLLKSLEQKNFVTRCSPEYCLTKDGEKVLELARQIKEPLIRVIEEDPQLMGFIRSSQAQK